MSILPYDMLEAIALYADIDSRRAMGFAPRKISFDVIFNMNKLIESKHTAQYSGYNSSITTLLCIEKLDSEITCAMYLSYDYNRDVHQIIHITGKLKFRNDNNTLMFFNTTDIVRAIVYSTFDAFDTKPLCETYKNCGLCCHVTPSNFELIRSMVKEII